MATLTLSIGALSSAKTISAAHQTRLQAAASAMLAQDQGIASPTNQQIVDYLMARIVADFTNLTRNVERATADAGVTNITIS